MSPYKQRARSQDRARMTVDCNCRPSTATVDCDCRPPTVLLLRQWLVEGRQRRNHRWPLLLRTLRGIVRHAGRGDWLVFLERLALSDTAHPIGVEHLTNKQLLGDLIEGRPIRPENAPRFVVVGRDDPLDLLIDADGRVLAVVLVLRDLAAEE